MPYTYSKTILYFICGILAACGHRTTPPSAPQRIVGTPELTPVASDLNNIPPEYRTLAAAVGLLNEGCTATHIGGGMMVTAGHCFAYQMGRENSRFLERKSCQGMRGIDTPVRWGYRTPAPNGSEIEVSESKCLEIIVAEWNAFRDYAIFTVDRAPEAFVPLDTGVHTPLGQDITIFSHPDATPLAWSHGCQVSSGSNLSDINPETQFTHSCDTEAGSSGAAVVDTLSLSIVGIHNGGDGNVRGETWNYATYSDQIPFR